MPHHPDYLRPEFEKAALGYLSCPAFQLEGLRRDLSGIVGHSSLSLRESAILKAVRHGVTCPDAWDEARKPLVFKSRPNGW